jgi:hypothetical protein
MPPAAGVGCHNKSISCSSGALTGYHFESKGTGQRQKELPGHTYFNAIQAVSELPGEDLLLQSLRAFP